MALTLLSLRKKTKLLGGIPYLVRQSKLSQAKPVQVWSGQVGASLGKSNQIKSPQITSQQGKAVLWSKEGLLFGKLCASIRQVL